MIIKISPVRMDAELAVAVSGDVLIVNGVTYDFGPLPDGAVLPADAIGCSWIGQPVERVAGELIITLTMPHGPDASEALRFPVDIINPPNGELRLPQ